MAAPSRVAVTAANIQAYLAANLTEGLYAQFYGLYMLDDAQYKQVWDALLNGDCEPEELVRLGSFSQAEIDSFISTTLGDWVSPGVATPAVGTSGYAYLTLELGLTSALQAAALGAVTVPGPSQGAFLGVRWSADVGGSGYASAAAIGAIFESEVLPGMLGSQPYGWLFPQTSQDVQDYVVPAGADSGAAAAVTSWYGSIFAPLYAIPAASIGTRLFRVDRDPTIPLAANPGLAQWLISEPELPQAFRLLLLREAAVRSAQGPYTKSAVSSQLSVLLGPPYPGPVATSRAMANLYLWSLILPAACANSLLATPGDSQWEAYAAQSADLAAAYAAIQAYRLRVRGALLAAYDGALANIQGVYPPA